MKTRTIYRIEHGEYTYGLYNLRPRDSNFDHDDISHMRVRGSDVCLEYGYDITCFESHPPPWCESERVLNFEREGSPSWFFGFSNIYQLKKWIGCSLSRQALNEAGFRMLVIEVNSRPKYFRESERQCVFDMEHAKILDKVLIPE